MSSRVDRVEPGDAPVRRPKKILRAATVRFVESEDPAGDQKRLVELGAILRGLARQGAAP